MTTELDLDGDIYYDENKGVAYLKLEPYDYILFFKNVGNDIQYSLHKNNHEVDYIKTRGFDFDKNFELISPKLKRKSDDISRMLNAQDQVMKSIVDCTEDSDLIKTLLRKNLGKVQTRLNKQHNNQDDIVSKIEWGKRLPEFINPFGLHENDDGLFLTELFWAKIQNNSIPRAFVIIDREEREEREEIVPLIHSNKKLFFDTDIILPNSDKKWLLQSEGVKKILEYDEDIKPLAQETFEKILGAINEKLWIPNIGIKKTLAYWIFGTYFFDIFNCYPIAHVYGFRASGKTRAGKLTQATSYHGMITEDVTRADLFRTKGEFKPTFIIDENEEVSSQVMGIRESILNSSYSKGGAKPSRRRALEQKNIDGDKTSIYVKDEWDVYSPTMLCSIGNIESEATRSRTLIMTMYMANKPYPDTQENEFRELQQNLYLIKFKCWSDIKKIYEEIKLQGLVEGFEPRESEIWNPLISIMKYLEREDQDKNDLITYAKENNTYKRTQDELGTRRYTIVKAIALMLSNNDLWKEITNNRNNIEMELKVLTEYVNNLELNVRQNKIAEKTINKELQKMRFTKHGTEKTYHPSKRTTTFTIIKTLFEEETQMLFGMDAEKLSQIDYDNHEVEYENVFAQK